MPHSKDLVIVCCHAVYHGDVCGNPRDEATWALQSFQRSHGLKQGEHHTFLKHIEAAFAVSRHDNTPAIVFSGGRTNPDYPHLSEARSYFDAARALSINNGREVLLEEFATDSYQNLLFSILVYRSKFGQYPSNISIVTHEFKTLRFRDLHAKAIRWPDERFDVMGINPPFSGESIGACRHRVKFYFYHSDTPFPISSDHLRSRIALWSSTPCRVAFH